MTNEQLQAQVREKIKMYEGFPEGSMARSTTTTERLALRFMDKMLGEPSSGMRAAIVDAYEEAEDFRMGYSTAAWAGIEAKQKQALKELNASQNP